MKWAGITSRRLQKKNRPARRPNLGPCLPNQTLKIRLHPQKDAPQRVPATFSQEDLENFKTRARRLPETTEAAEGVDQREKTTFLKRRRHRRKKMRKRLQARQDDLTALRENMHKKKRAWSQERAPTCTGRETKSAQALIARGNEVASPTSSTK